MSKRLCRERTRGSGSVPISTLTIVAELMGLARGERNDAAAKLSAAMSLML